MNASRPLLSFVIPAYHVSDTIGETLDSIYRDTEQAKISIETIVVDDGSADGEALTSIVARFPSAKLIRHPANRGMCAARNTGILSSTGDYVTILDADDRLVERWTEVFAAIEAQWPTEANVCYASCVTQYGESTSADPSYSGWLTLYDILNERRSGEHLPMFRGNYVRDRLYIDLHTRKSCGIVSYIRFAHDAPFWISAHVLRIYRTNRTGSVTQRAFAAEKAAESAKCHEVLLQEYGPLMRQHAPAAYGRKLLRLAIYRRYAGLGNWFGVWRDARRWSGLAEWCAAFLLLMIGRRGSTAAIAVAKRIGAVRRYG